MLRRIVFALATVAAGHAFAGAGPNAAHELAQKFAGQPEMTATAPAPNAAAKPATETKAAETKPKPPSPAPAKGIATTQPPVAVKPFANPASDAPATSAPAASKIATSDRPPLDYEMDMLRRARAEQADRKAAEKPAAPAVPAKIVVTPPAATPAAPPPVTATSTAKPESTTVAPTAPAAPPAKAAEPTKIEPAKIEPAKTDPAKIAPSAPVLATPAPVKAEPQKLVEAPATATAVAAPTPAAPAAAAPAVAAPPAPAGPAVQASVLLAIETGGASSKSDDQALDPIICSADTCFISAGLTADAVKLSKADALKLKSSNDASQDACRGKVGCVFRNVGLSKGALIEVVEIGATSSAPAQTYAAEPDASCKTADGGLFCENPIATADFRIWIVPEATAKTAGADAIEDAVADSLPHRDIARDTDK